MTATPITVQLDIGLDTTIDYARKQVGEDDWASRPITIAEAVVERTAQLLMDKIVRDETGGYKSLRTLVADTIHGAIAERVNPLVDKALEGDIPLTNGYGEKTGSTTMREEIVRQVGKHLGTTNHSSASKTVFVKAIEDTTAAVLTKELANEVKSAKDLIRGAVAASASEVLAKAILDGVTARG